MVNKTENKPKLTLEVFMSNDFDPNDYPEAEQWEFMFFCNTGECAACQKMQRIKHKGGP